MAWTPISGQPVPYRTDTTDVPASGYYLKAYVSGTTTAISFATNQGGGTTLDKSQLDSAGYPTTDGTTRFIPHVNQTYKLVLYLNATDADNNTVGSADWVIDDIPQSAASTQVSTRQKEYQLGSQAVSRVFTLTNSYTLGNENLEVRLNGNPLRSGSSFDYTETSTNSVTLTYDPLDNDVYSFVTTETTTSSVADAAGITYTPAGSGAVATNVQAKLRGLYITPQDFGAVADGVTDDTAAIQAALDSDVGTVYFPQGTYVTSSPLVLDYNHCHVLIGASRRYTIIENSTSDVFDIGDVNDAGFFSISELFIRSRSGGGHCFNQNYATGTSMFMIRDCKIQNDNTGKSLWNQTVAYSGGGLVENCHLVATPGVTVNPWYINSSQVVNGWCFRDIRADYSDNAKQFFHIDTTNASSFITNMRFENITFELTNGGMIFAAGKHIIIENCGSYDLSTTQTGHGVWIGQSSGGLNPQRVRIQNVQKSPISGYALGVGIQDVKLDSAQSFFMDNVDSNTGATLIDYGNSKGVHFNTPASPTYANDSLVMKCVGDQIDLPGEITANSFKLDTSSSTWDSGSGNPEGSATAEPGSIYSRSTPSTNQILYAKLSGSSNTGWNLIPSMESAGSTEFNDATDSINTSGKAEGRVAYDTTTQKILFASGSGATATWKNFNGTVEYTPS